MIKDCDKKVLKVILKICKNVSNSNIKDLMVSQLDNNLQIDQRDNLLVKTQGLLNLYECDIPREIANSVINLFSDPHEVTVEQEKLFGKQQSKAVAKQNNNDKIKGVDKVSAQNNKINKMEQSDSQGQ